MSFTLKRIIWDNGKPSERDDFEVMLDDKAVGRIYLRNDDIKERWNWSIYGGGVGHPGMQGESGLADTLDCCMVRSGIGRSFVAP